MAFKTRNLSILTYANSYTHWHYKSEDDIATTCAPGYFAPAADMMSARDTVITDATEGVFFRVVSGTNQNIELIPLLQY
jgi:hypothetical protein